MSQPFPPNARSIFTHDGPVQEPVPITWRSITRTGRPFLLLPDAEVDLHLGLGLYSAQRKRAKVLRAFLPMIFRSPAKIWFHQVRLEADATTDLMRFMAEQSGVPVSGLKTPGIKFGGVAQRSRLALLLGDKTCRPVKVIKVGLNPAGRTATDREAALLEKLPPDKLGCIRLTGRLSTSDVSAFSTDYFPGVSPNDDSGMELLFHSWLNPGPPVPIETLPTWQEMWTAIAEAHPNGWEALQSALGGKKIRTALFHGDFAPWNISAVNSRNLQVFDWERGHLQGIPAWDWFHFIVQTSILARRLSVERIAAELEHLIHSDRFLEYARAAGISDIVKPLLLAYLLHHKWVNKPMEGGATTARLYEFLTAHWRIKSLHANAAPLPVAREPAPTNLWASARCQLKSAAAQWINLFWEPSLSFRIQSSVPSLILVNWSPILLAALLLTTVATTQYFASGHLVFLPLYLAVCALLTWQAGRRLGVAAATIAAVLGPLLVGLKDPGHGEWEWFLWNTMMRFIILQMGVLFVGRIHEQRNILRHETTFFARPVKIADNWAVLLASGLALVGVTWLDYVTDPRMIFLPLYLIPCTVITLVTNLRWGIIASLITVGDSSFIEYDTNLHDTLLRSFGWNFTMRFLVFLGVIMLVNIIRKQHILFSPRK